VQVDPIKPTSIPPGTKRLKLQYDELLSNVAFKINLCRYIKARAVEAAAAVNARMFGVPTGRACQILLATSHDVI